DYLDSSSSQMILALIYKFKTIFDKSKNLKVEWHYMEDDYDILETGETYSELSGLDFEFISHI
ncbi:MAG: SiaC family regulatory phosphoprotein, partial [Bacteroidota bacterium]